jgi:hypothetical protein
MPSPGDDDHLDVVRDQLTRRGWEARVVRYSLVGDDDVRLDVGRPGSPAVQLLGACGGLPCRERWQAVRITDDGRAVWRGPSHECPQADLIAFLEDLLGRDDAELAERYRRLG